MLIQIAGPGCPRCEATEDNVRKACERLEEEAEIVHVYDPMECAKLGVGLTPAVLIDEKVVFSGRVPTVAEMEEIIEGYL